ncbi:MAG: transcription antitermination factor NusB [Firmicutes bacterium]|nr:transcription antitermination factor NusB [Bacillota bacterium]
MSRHVAREIAFQTLFQYDQGNNGVEPALSALLEDSGLRPALATFSRELVVGTLEKQEELDQVILPYLQHWQFDRLAAVDRSILRLAVYELLYRDDIPSAVSINEALELCKAYNGEESAKFLNGVLDKLIRERADSKGEE